MQSLQPSGFAEIDRLTVVFRRTRDLLDVAVMTGDLSAEATAGFVEDAARICACHFMAS